jgi:MbtH protein
LRTSFTARTGGGPRSDIGVLAGWQPVGKEGTEAECSTSVDEVWTGMRPRSLRERMENAEA